MVHCLSCCEREAIVYNSAHAVVRQRFTFAHEIAHFLLHAKRGGKPQLFIDGYMSFRRDATSSTGTDRDEVEANQLAAALLMPRSLIEKELLSNDLNLDDEESTMMTSSAVPANRVSARISIFTRATATFP